MRHRLLIAARSLLLGWVALFAITYLVERPLLSWSAPLLGASWLPTAQLALACAGLAATGWIVGQGNRFDALIFLATWVTGLAMSMMPAPRPVAAPRSADISRGHDSGVTA